MKKIIIAALAAAVALDAGATVPHRFNVPDIPGYITLKGDFHNHTVFSDGVSWPVTVMEEAYYDDLDIISITDHNESRHRHKVLEGYFNADKCTRNASYEIAAEVSKKYGVMVIHGSELTRGLRLFPGHFNTHFLQDGEALAKAAESQDGKIKDPVKREEAAIFNGLREAKRQGAFLVWNHPNWEKQAPNRTEWLPLHEKVYEEGLMQGIEVENHLVGFSPEAFHWAMERNLTILSGSDAHYSMTTEVNYEKGEHRSMTFVFAKERSLESVREALDNHRTAVYANDCVYGRQEYLMPLFKGIIKVTKIKYSKGKVTYSLANESSIPVSLSKAPGSESVVYRRELRLDPGCEQNVAVAPILGADDFESYDFDIHFYVDNFYTDADTPMEVTVHLTIPEKYRTEKKK